MLIVKVVVQKGWSGRWDAMIGQIGDVSHHLQSLWGAIELAVCVHSYTKWDILML